MLWFLFILPVKSLQQNGWKLRPVAEFKEFERRFKLSRGLNMVGST